jgi:hypothetical protein
MSRKKDGAVGNGASKLRALNECFPTDCDSLFFSFKCMFLNVNMDYVHLQSLTSAIMSALKLRSVFVILF